MNLKPAKLSHYQLKYRGIGGQLDQSHSPPPNYGLRTKLNLATPIENKIIRHCSKLNYRVIFN